MTDSTAHESLSGNQHEHSERTPTLKEKMKQPRFWFIWIVRLLVFSITGSLSVRLTSLFVHNVLGMEGKL
jgi:cytoskeletal protein RodZ